MPPSDGPGLVIDAHAHIFNVWDIPASDWVVNVLLRPPDAVLNAILKWGVGAFMAFLRSQAVHPASEIVLLRSELGSSADAVPKLSTPGEGTATDIAAVENVVARMLGELQPAPEAREPITEYMTDVVAAFTRPRFGNAERLATFFPNGPQVFVAAMVDFAYPLRDPKNPAPLAAQIEATALAAIRAGGRILPFVAFDPFRDVFEDGGALALAKRAVEEAGFAGVKLYPPMGFRPLGNVEDDEDAERQTQLDQLLVDVITGAASTLSVPQLKAGLDQSLTSLYRWAAADDVPILAHAGRSNGADALFDDMSAPAYWFGLFEDLADQSIDPPRFLLGHFGGMAVPDDEIWVKDFIDLVGKHSALYGDVACFDTRDAAAVDAYFDALVGEHSTALWNALMYGSDWHLISTTQPDAAGHLDRIRQCMATRLSDAQRAAFFSGNAVEFLGLKNGRKNRARLDAFYTRAGIHPAWTDLVS